MTATQTTYLKDYQAPKFAISHCDLEIHLKFQTTRIIAKHKVIRKHPDAEYLTLDCEELVIESIAIDGIAISQLRYQLKDNKLFINCNQDCFDLTIVNTTNPAENTALSGLYQSKDMLCTQCEAEGFRKITPSIDRPDSASIYTVKLIADKETFPTLLSNGNNIENGEIDDNLHYTIWHDPFPKPTYLFAIVAGKLNCLEDHFTTQSNKPVTLRFYTRDNDINKCHYAMQCLKHAMTWDEKVYGREYDLDVFNVVAVEDFNMGAMENKSLNIFNTKYVLADTRIATDQDHIYVQGIIGHEYFHNWSGNRVTCRDWFQLSLKEGFTVFRDQEFSADMGSRGVKRIEDVQFLRNHQFREDASAMAHPVQPKRYQEINNFYTSTVYNKGAEVVRMQHTLLGEKLFRKGCDLYFDTFDGMAVTTDDFVACMEQSSTKDLARFKNWYHQSGTPIVKVCEYYCVHSQTYTLTLSQSNPTAKENEGTDPLVIPIRISLFSEQGEKFDLKNSQGELLTELVLELDEKEKEYVFDPIPSPPVISLLRGFSAPIELNHTPTDQTLFCLMAHDDDPFNKWEAAQKLYTKYLLEAISQIDSDKAPRFPQLLPKTIHAILSKAFLSKQGSDKAFTAKLLELPGAQYLSEKTTPINPQSIHFALEKLNQLIASKNQTLLLKMYAQCHAQSSGAINEQEMGERKLRDACLKLLGSLDGQSKELSQRQLKNSHCMTDAFTAIQIIAQSNRADKQSLLDDFYVQWEHEPLVIDKWLRVQATAITPQTLETVHKLTQHPAFNPTNPNKVYALILAYTHGNFSCFHHPDGSGYQFAQDWIIKLDKINPQVAARLAGCFNGWNKYIPGLRDKMLETLIALNNRADLSIDVKEIIEKNLTQPKESTMR